MRSIIIDDEEKSHVVLKYMLEKQHPDVEVVGSGYTVKGGIQLILKHRPDLVFLDVEMPDGTGFDLLQIIGRPKFKVIFITAHNEYAVSAIRFGALDYLLKPLIAEQLFSSLELVREKLDERDLIEQARHANETFQQLQQDKLPSRMIVSTLEGIFFIPINEIIRLEADANFTEIFYTSAKKRLIASVNIGAYEEQFAPYKTFMRVHRAHLVNLLMVDAYVRGDAQLHMKDGSEVAVSKDNREELLKRLKEI